MQLTWSLLGLAAVIVVMNGCARYQPAPVVPAKTAEALESRSLADAALRGFLETNLHRTLGEWPLKDWDFEQLTLAACYFHPSLDVARARWSVAKAGELTAGARPNPTASVGPAYNINAASGVTPWLALVDLDFPIETAGKRGYRIAQAKHFSQAARLSIGAVAWQVRSRLRLVLLEFVDAGRRAQLLRAQIAIQEQVLQRLEQKLAAGAVARSEITPHRIGLQKARIEVAEAERWRAEARAKVADALGVPLRALDGVALPEALPDFAAAAAPLTSAEARCRALHSRADILAALAEYEATQSALQLEIAKQYPDLRLGPGYEYDQGENKFGFNLSLELPVFHRNQGPIAEATAKREESAAQFTALQARVLGEIDQALTAFRAGEQQASAVDALLAAQRQQQASVRAQIEGGVAEPLDLLTTQLELAAGELARHHALMKCQQALARLEDVMQRPFEAGPAAAETLSRTSQPR
ncbi:MAG: TolC family protein [Verrucomicrobia bacterium]|nr:TolC family protein [Verrucomicrobiota bacterium]